MSPHLTYRLRDGVVFAIVGGTVIRLATLRNHAGMHIEAWREAGRSGETATSRITPWLKVQEVRTGAAPAGTSGHKLTLAENAALEIYDYPGEYAQRFDGVDPGGAAGGAPTHRHHGRVVWVKLSVGMRFPRGGFSLPWRSRLRQSALHRDRPGVEPTLQCAQGDETAVPCGRTLIASSMSTSSSKLTRPQGLVEPGGRDASIRGVPRFCVPVVQRWRDGRRSRGLEQTSIHRDPRVEAGQRRTGWTGAGHPGINEIVVTKLQDCASPVLLKVCAAGVPIRPTKNAIVVNIDFTRAHDNGAETTELSITLHDVVMERDWATTSSDAGSASVERYRLRYTKMTYSKMPRSSPDVSRAVEARMRRFLTAMEGVD